MTTVKAQEKHVTVNGVRLRYLDCGAAGKTPLVCLHGHTGQAHIWDEFAEAMAPHYHVLAVDQRGHGESQWAGSGYARNRFVEDLSALVDQLGLSKFVLAGHSMGGWHSLLYTPDHQDRVARIVLVDIGPESSPPPPAASRRPPTPMEFPSLDDAIRLMRRYNPWVSDARLRKDAADKMRRKEAGGWTWKADPSLFNIVLPDMTDPSLISRYWKAVETITCPILEVRGAESGVVSDEILKNMKQRGKHLTSIDVAGAGHGVPVDNPYGFIEATRGFLGVSG